MQVIQYGIGKDYLKDWGINEALREIYQNFIDYGTFKQQIIPVDNDNVRVIISNDYIPENLEFLQIGKSIKEGNKEAIGQHGEGLKMAMLIFLRLNYRLSIHTHNKFIYAEWRNQKLIGDTLALLVQTRENIIDSKPFTISIMLPKAEFDAFNDNLIKKKDILFTAEQYGSIVDKEPGNLYVGKLFVCKLKNFKKSYNLNASILRLDRDRRVPNTFDTNWNTSKINEAEAKYNFVDQNYNDMEYVQSVPKELYTTIKAKAVGNSIEFIAKVDGQDIVIKNEHIKTHLKQQSYFQKALQGIKLFLISKLGVKDLILEFRTKYCYSTEMKEAFDVIIDKLGISLEDKNTNQIDSDNPF